MFSKVNFAEETWYKSSGYYPITYETMNTNYSLNDCGLYCRSMTCTSIDMIGDTCYINYYHIAKGNVQIGGAINHRAREQSLHYEMVGYKYGEDDKGVCTFKPTTSTDWIMACKSLDKYACSRNN